MAELTASCCSTDAQATCCEPSEKAGCCDERAAAGSCGCSADESRDIRETDAEDADGDRAVRLPA
jgi:hypothetical protein